MFPDILVYQSKYNQSVNQYSFITARRSEESYQLGHVCDELLHTDVGNRKSVLTKTWDRICQTSYDLSQDYLKTDLR